LTGNNALKWFSKKNQYIELKLEQILHLKSLKSLSVIASKLPGYRMVDIRNAVETFAKTRGTCETINSEHVEDLKSIIHSEPYEPRDRLINSSTRTTWQKNVKDDVFLPNETYWLFPSKTQRNNLVIRIKHEQYQDKVSLEVACSDVKEAEKHLNEIIGISIRDSIYRGEIIHLVHQAEKRDEYGDIEKQERLHVTFSQIMEIVEKDIILSEKHIRLLTRNILDLYNRKEILEANGIPAKRGVLLYGPPGTGKTFACRHLCSQLPGVTKFFISGSTLPNVGAVFSLAKLYQPSIIFMEDADLIFSQRDINAHGTILGELMDQMDGMKNRENVSVVMTTNAIDRIEDALKNRPGRVSQCIYMGEPDAGLRKRYLEHLLKDHDTSVVDINRQVRAADGATQAFLKEWVFRTLQIACERVCEADEKPRLRDADFIEAMTEMQTYLENNGSRIIGFTSGLHQS